MGWNVVLMMAALNGRASIRTWLLVFWLVPGTGSILAGSSSDGPWTIVAENIRLHLLPREGEFLCTDTLLLSGRNSDETVSLRLFPLFRVDAVAIAGRPGKFTQDRGGIHVQAPRDSTLQIVIRYGGEISRLTEFTSLTSERAVLKEEDIFPDGPKLLKRSRITVVVPSSWTAVTTGTLTAEITAEDSTAFTWSNDRPVPNIGWVVAGPYRRQTLVADGVEFSAYCFTGDSSQAATEIALSRKLIRFYSSLFAPYRFTTLKLIEVEDWVAGRGVLAIAGPSYVLIKKMAYVTEDRYNQFTTILPHEVAHQWWGETVSVPDEDRAFLSEGLCEYSSILYAESSRAGTPRDSLDRHPLLRALLLRAQQGKDAPLQQSADLRMVPTQYLKAAYVHHMLRRLLGDSLFKCALSELARRELANVPLLDFQNIAERLSGRRLGWFFDQWVRGAGIPRMKLYNVRAEREADGAWLTRGRVRIVGYEKFNVAGDVGLNTDTGMVVQPIRLGTDSAGLYRNDVAFGIVTSTKPFRASFDPRGDVLKVRRMAVRMGELREPSDGILVVGTGPGSGGLRSLAQRDSSMMEEGGWNIRIREDSSVSLGDLQSGHVILYGLPSQNRVVAMNSERFPFPTRHDSVVIGGEAIFDSALALIQSVENPYSRQHILVWVAPLSGRADPRFLPYDYSWVLVRGTEEISSGTWDVIDEDLGTDIR